MSAADRSITHAPIARPPPAAPCPRRQRRFVRPRRTMGFLSVQEADPALIASTLFAEPEPLLDESSAQAVEQTSEQKDAEITAELLVIAEALEAYVEQNGSLPDQSLFSEPDQAAATLQLKVEQLTYPGGDVLNASDDNSRAYQLLYTEEGNGFIVSALASDGSTVLSETR